MNRRNFLRLLTAAPIVAVSPVLAGDGIQLTSIAHPTAAELALATNDAWAKALYPGIQKWYADKSQ